MALHTTYTRTYKACNKSSGLGLCLVTTSSVELQVSVNACVATGPPMKARLARSGHLSSIIGHLMVVSGGILRDGSLCMDLVIMDLATLTFIKSVKHTVAIMHAVPMLQLCMQLVGVLAITACCKILLLAVSALPLLAKSHMSTSWHVLQWYQHYWPSSGATFLCCHAILASVELAMGTDMRVATLCCRCAHVAVPAF